jgi:hypothetical protein
MYDAAYEAVLKQWTVPCDELFVPNRCDDAHVITSGSRDTAPLMLL